MIDSEQQHTRSNFRKFFLRGLGILLPTVLTIWILIAAYGFVQNRIAKPINAGVRQAVVKATPWPRASEADLTEVQQKLTGSDRVRAADPVWLEQYTRRQLVEQWWGKYAFPMDLIGLLLAVVLIYGAGLALGSYIGRRLYNYGEGILQRLPLIRQVYPSVKQVTDFFVGEGSPKLRFSRVVAVEYPRKGIWSVGLVTGETMQAIETRAGYKCLTIFVPSSPTPFTGYVITVSQDDTIDLPITIDDAIRFSVSGGVIVPDSQRIIRTPLETPQSDCTVA